MMILAAILAGYLHSADNSSDHNKKMSTIEKMQTIVRMLEGYANKEKHLPCPALLNLEISNTNFGRAQNCSGAIPPPPAVIVQLSSSPIIWRGCSSSI